MGQEGREMEMMMMKWKEFLPTMMVRVLLVEFDDSKRQIITALLRKCSYEGIDGDVLQWGNLETHELKRKEIYNAISVN
ncbi:Two-component response regulator-like [Nymphaea thermarum]|nr:Two-component response regulator-like [Nymphaea thermarum]